MVLVCGDPAEPVTVFVRARLRNLGIKHQFLNLRVFPRGFDLKWSWEAGKVRGWIAGPKWRLDLDDLTGVYFRNVSIVSTRPKNANEETGRAYPTTREELLSLLNCLKCPVVNRQAAMTSNRSKPFQALVIRRFGLKVPKTLVTNSSEAARSFYTECDGEVIFKSISGVRSIVRRLRPEHFDRLALLEHGPTQFQEFVPGENIRVHTVGERVLAVRIESDAVDYRYARMERRKRKMTAMDLPPELEKACLDLSRELGLLMAGIDLKRTPEGAYYCFEVNASPGFLFFERASRPFVADVLGEFLAGKTSPRN
jgi:glutathione synthase/RimK-type ligase-like ATP-grasp enzyme